MRNISSSLSAVKKISLGIFLLSMLLTGGTVGLSAHAQVSYPDNIFASTNQAQLHELVLKATQENGQTNTVSGFKVDLTNVVSTPTNSELAIFTTDNALSVVEAKVKSTSDTYTDLIKKNANAFSLAGLPPGVYTLDVIAQKQNSKAAYEGLVVIGQPVNEVTKQTVQKEIVKQETNVNIVFEKPKQQPRKIVDKEGTCLFTPSHPICKPDPQGKCPRGWGTNEGGQCFPMYKKCPAGYWRADDDETGACVPLPKEPVALAALPPCDGSNQDCIYNGHLCKAGSAEHACELPLEEEEVEADQALSCQPEDDFCEPGCESPSMDCIDDVNIGDDGEDSSDGGDDSGDSGGDTGGNEGGDGLFG